MTYEQSLKLDRRPQHDWRVSFRDRFAGFAERQAARVATRKARQARYRPTIDKRATC
jgi:hypothetical protein